MARTRPTRAETRRRILDAAFEVFGQRGIAASSLSEVAGAAGLTKGAVYSNFGSKDELVLTLMEEHAGHRIQASLEAVEAAGTTESADVLGTVAAVLVHEMQVDAVAHRLLAEYVAMTGHDPVRRAALQERRREVRAAITRALERVVESLDIQLPMPAADFAVVILALSNGLGVESDIDPGGFPDDLLARVLTLIAGDGVRVVQEAAARVALEG